MSLLWTAAARDAVGRHGEAGYPNEICGILIGERAGADKVVREVLPVENRWEALDEQRRRFLIASANFKADRPLRGGRQHIFGRYNRRNAIR